jgi:hypothetical protein
LTPLGDQLRPGGTEEVVALEQVKWFALLGVRKGELKMVPHEGPHRAGGVPTLYLGRSPFKAQPSGLYVSYATSHELTKTALWTPLLRSTAAAITRSTRPDARLTSGASASNA